MAVVGSGGGSVYRGREGMWRGKVYVGGERVCGRGRGREGMW